MICCTENTSPVTTSPVTTNPVISYTASVSSITGFSMYVNYAKNRSLSPSQVSQVSPSPSPSPSPIRRIITPDIIKELHTSPKRTPSPKLYQMYSTVTIPHYSLSNSLSNSPSNSPFNSPSTMRVYYSPNTLARFLSSINETD